jgi:3-isopropylmalate/(R)-2-methylmalate dehydratase small subunit
MRAFTRIRATAAALPIANVDTDKIIPARFLKTVSRTGLGTALFNDMRYWADGTPIPEFVLNRAPWDQAGILIAGDNFGCGSSREHAPWALLDFGITCIIAPSFADIFYNNCFKNGILPIIQSADVCDEMTQVASNPLTATTVVDLVDQEIVVSDRKIFNFEIDPGQKDILLNGRDDITMSLEKADDIAAFEAASEMRWMPGIPLNLLEAIERHDVAH